MVSYFYLINEFDKKRRNICRLIFLVKKKFFCMDKLINKLYNSLNQLINQGYDDKITKSSNKLLKTLENCTSCKYNIKDKYFYEFHKSKSEIENHVIKLEKEEQGKEDIINQLNNELIKMD